MDDTLDHLSNLISAIRPLTARNMSDRLRDEFLEAVLASVPVAIVGRDGQIEFATESLEDLFGYLPGALRGKPYTTLIPDQYKSAHADHFAVYWERPARRAMGQSPHTLRGVRKDGTTFDVSVGLTPRALSCGEVVVVTVLAQRGQ